MTLTGTSSITIDNGWGYTSSSIPLTYYSTTPAGTSLRVDKDPSKEGINPRLMFKFVKSKFKMNPKQKEWHTNRLKKLAKLINQSKELNQTSMFEHLSQLMAIAVRESEMQSYFVDGAVQWINKADLLKYQTKVAGKCVFFKKIEDFPRPIPSNVALRIKTLQEHKVFDEIWILYLDYTKEEIKTNEKKIKEKDPIAFGCISYNPDTMYYITDWIDERCDLTLDKVVESLKDGNKEFDLGELPEVDEEYVNKIKEEVLNRHNRLKETNSSNWREKELEAKVAAEKEKWKQEAEEKIKRELEEKAKNYFINKLKFWKRK